MTRLLRPAGSGCRDPENRNGNKTCCCGFHSAQPKKNKNHNSTRRRLSVRKTRAALAKMLEKINND